MGDSSVRHVSQLNAQAICHPGARVLDINSIREKFRLLFASRHCFIVIVHVGSNDVSSQQTEALKGDFKVTLTQKVLDSRKCCEISGPLSAPRYRDVKFNPIRQFRIGLKGYCYALSLPYVDNFPDFLGGFQHLSCPSKKFRAH